VYFAKPFSSRQYSLKASLVAFPIMKYITTRVIIQATNTAKIANIPKKDNSGLSSCSIIARAGLSTRNILKYSQQIRFR